MSAAISIILPVYNEENCVSNMLDDIRCQTFRNFECLVVDDGSSDSSGEICDRYAQSDPRIRVIHIPNGGVSHARNIALDAAEGDYITFVDADDRLAENYLEVLYQNVSDGADMAVCSLQAISSNGTSSVIEAPFFGRHRMRELIPTFARTQKETGIFGYCCGKLVSAKCMRDNRFQKDIKLAEDLDFYLRFYPNMESIVFIRQPLYIYSLGGVGEHSLPDDYAVDYLTQLKIRIRMWDFLKQYRENSEDNDRIMKETIQSYTYFCLFYCPLNQLRQMTDELYEIQRNHQLTFRDMKVSGMKKYILRMFERHQVKWIRCTLQAYRSVRKFVRGNGR